MPLAACILSILNINDPLLGGIHLAVLKYMLFLVSVMLNNMKLYRCYDWMLVALFELLG